jgi:plasmid stabilization system protein ParE
MRGDSTDKVSLRNMVTVSREDLHRAVERLPDERLAAAAELLDALAEHDRRVLAWKDGLTEAEATEIADSLRREYAPGQWITDTQVEQWIESSGASGDPSDSQTR